MHFTMLYVNYQSIVPSSILNITAQLVATVGTVTCYTGFVNSTVPDTVRVVCFKRNKFIGSFVSVKVEGDS